MTLKQKIADVRTLLEKIEDGWRNKCIFQGDYVEYRYPGGKSTTQTIDHKVLSGWATIIYAMEDLLGFNALGRDEKGCRNILTCGFSEQGIWNLIYHAKEFLCLMETPDLKTWAAEEKDWAIKE